MKKLDGYLKENDINLLEVSEEVWLHIQKLSFKQTEEFDYNDSEQLKLLEENLRDRGFSESDIYHDFFIGLVETCLSLIKEKKVIKDQDKKQWVFKKASVVDVIINTIKKYDEYKVIERLSKWKLFEQQIFFYILLIVIKYGIDIRILNYWNISFKEFNGTLFDMIPIVVLIGSCLICSFIYSFSLKKIKEYIVKEDSIICFALYLGTIVIIPVMIYIINNFLNSTLNATVYAIISMISVWILYPFDVVRKLMDFEKHIGRKLNLFLKIYFWSYVTILSLIYFIWKELFGLFFVIFFIGIIYIICGIFVSYLSDKEDYIMYSHIKNIKEKYPIIFSVIKFCIKGLVQLMLYVVKWSIDFILSIVKFFFKLIQNTLFLILGILEFISQCFINKKEIKESIEQRDNAEQRDVKNNERMRFIRECVMLFILLIIPYMGIKVLDKIIDQTQESKMEYYLISYEPEDIKYIDYDNKFDYFYNDYFYVAVVYTTNDYFICKPLIQKDGGVIEIDRNTPAIQVPRSNAIIYYTTSLSNLPKEHIIIKK